MISTTKAALALCGSSLLFVGCAGGELETPTDLLVYGGSSAGGSGGTGGSAGSGAAGAAGAAGKSGSAGAAGKSGSAGSAGAGGKAGAAGQSGGSAGAAGSAGKGGAAGTAGSAGAAGSTAGSAGSNAGSAGSTAGSAGAGGGTKACTAPSECPGSDDECQQRTCSADGVCGLSFTADNTPITTQTVGDCKSTVCDGAGKTKIIPGNDAPAPKDECTTITCDAGAPVTANTAPGTKCGAGLLLVCDGNGACLGCNAPSDCAGEDTECSKRTCEAGACGTTTTAPGTVLVAGQTTGNCSRKVCGPLGTIVDEPDNDDRPSDDGDECTAEVCALGVPGHPLQPVNTACTRDGGKFCNALGACVACTNATQCTPGTNECQTATCSPAGACGIANGIVGTPTPSQTPNDCKTQVCAAQGTLGSSADLLDVPVSDGNPCTAEGCDANGTTSTKLPAGTICDVATGNRCNASAACVGACVDGVQDIGETDIDCGGLVCAKCANTKKCLVPTDCASGNCAGGVCTPTAPKVVSIAPLAGALVPTTGTPIAITFDQEMDLASFSTATATGTCATSTSTVRVSGDLFVTCNAFVASTLTLSADKKTVTGVLAGGLAAGATLQVAVTSGAKSEAGIDATPFVSTPGYIVARQVACTTGAPDVVISQIYGGGGNVGATFANDFIELHNRSSAPVRLAGWSLQYAGATSDFGGGNTARFNFADGAVIAPGGYFLVAAAGGANAAAALPTPDATSGITLSATAGKVALVRTTAQLVGGATTGTCPSSPDIADIAAYGTNATCGEGASTTASLSEVRAAFRKSYGCADTQSTTADFDVLLPKPRNAATPVALCGCNDFIANELDRSFEADYCKVLTTSLATTAPNGTLPAIAGEIYEDGVTQPAGEAATIIAQFAIAPSGAAITAGGSWTFFGAGFSSQVGNNDQYSVAPAAPSTTGKYGYLYRFSLDGRKSWTYCDKDGAGSNLTLGLDDAQRGDLLVQLAKLVRRSRRRRSWESAAAPSTSAPSHEAEGIRGISAQPLAEASFGAEATVAGAPAVPPPLPFPGIPAVPAAPPVPVTAQVAGAPFVTRNVASTAGQRPGHVCA